MKQPDPMFYRRYRTMTSEVLFPEVFFPTLTVDRRFM